MDNDKEEIFFSSMYKALVKEDESLKKIFEENINEYLLSRKYVYGEKAKDRSITLMDLATIAAKEQKRKGKKRKKLMLIKY